MKRLNLPTVLAFALLCSIPAQAWADDNPTKQPGAQVEPESLKTQKKTQEQVQEKKQEQKLEQKQEKKQEQKQEQKQEKKQEQQTGKEQKEPAPFVDRNGDGIQDGHEHRFRGRHRRGGKRSGDDKGELQRQHGKHKAGGSNR